MSNEIYKANDVQLRQQIKAHLDEADSDISALDTRVTQNESDIDDLEAADVVQDGRLDTLEGFTPGKVRFDGSSYYSLTYTSSGNLVTAVCTFAIDSFSGGTPATIIQSVGPSSRIRIQIQAKASDDATAALQNTIVATVENSAGTQICRLVSPVGFLDGESHTLFFSFSGTAGTATYYIDGASADDAGNASRTAPTTGTLDSGASSILTVGSVHTAGQYLTGNVGYVWFRNAYLANWDDFMDSAGNPLDIDTDGWTELGAQPIIGNPHGQMHHNLGSGGDMTVNGTLTLTYDGIESAWTVPDEELDSRLTAIEPISGTFSPTIQDASFSNSESQSYSEQIGIYRKTGDVVTFWIELRLSSLGTLTSGDQIALAGLPFTSASLGANYAATVGAATGMNITAGNGITAFVPEGVTYCRLRLWSATGGSTAANISHLTSSSVLFVSGQYIAV